MATCTQRQAMTSEKILLVSAPDDVLEDAIRILVVDLDKHQSNIFSQALLTHNQPVKSIIYNWVCGEDINWLFDKCLKSDVIVFNADSINQTLVGYLAGRRNSYYFGTLKTLQVVNKSAIYDMHQCCEILERNFETYGKT